MARPPIVGVPALVMWPWGPSSRMGWPMPWTWSQRMRAGVPTTDTTSETAPATRREITGSPAVPGQPGQRRPCDLSVVEGHGAVGEHLGVLVALAGENHHVPGPGRADGGADGGGPVRLHEQPVPAHRTAQHIVDDHHRVLAAGVVRREH